MDERSTLLSQPAPAPDCNSSCVESGQGPQTGRKPKIAIVAGTGALAGEVIGACQRRGRSFFVLAIEGQTAPEVVADVPHAWVRLGAAGKALKLLKEAEVHEVVLAGPVERPSLKDLRPDFWATRFLASNGWKLLDDGDGLLGAIIKELEEREGFRVVSLETLLHAG